MFYPSFVDFFPLFSLFIFVRFLFLIDTAIESLSLCVWSVCCMILAVWCVHTFSIAYTLFTLLLLLLLLKDATALMLHKFLRAVSYSLTKISFSIIYLATAAGAGAYAMTVATFSQSFCC